MAASPSRLPRAPEAAAAAAGKGDPRQAGSGRPLLSNPGSSSPAGQGASPLRGQSGLPRRLPGAGSRSPWRGGPGAPLEPRFGAAAERGSARGASRESPGNGNWRRGERGVPGGPWAEVTPRGPGRGIPGESKMADKEKKKKESILDLSKYIDKTIRVKFQGGREASGVLKGFDPLLNLVLDGTIEYMRDPDDQYKLTEDTRQLGLVVCRGTSVVLICPQDGMEAIPNPFIQQQDG
ncbi:U6 snRNA-associated Sm-like protein LSm7 [Pantherophis guttatus]|nr:U6 snRNA-associated Sm-like protein LSm7 [Pantherophis guttatus]